MTANYLAVEMLVISTISQSHNINQIDINEGESATQPYFDDSKKQNNLFIQ